MRFKLTILLLTVMMVIVACSSADGDSPPATAQPMLQGSVDIMFPVSGAIIYSESVIVEGVSDNPGEDGFQLRMIAPDDTVLAEANIQPVDSGNWSIELVHDYAGDPTEVTLVAAGIQPDIPLDYDIESIAIAPLEFRPDGVFGSINLPEDGSQVGGDSIQVTGRGSGFFENSFVLSLVNTEGEATVEIPVTMQNPNFIDDMFWEAQLPRDDFIGNGSIRISYQDAESGDIIIVDEVDVIVSAIAG